MKVLVELLAIVILIMSGWRQSFHEHASRLFPNAPFSTEPIRFRLPPPPVVAYPQSPPGSVPVNGDAAGRDKSWLWNKTPLDRR